ncbi:MAG TPA: acyltransferase family protein [Candidatus Saccharimonadales bacterium]|nr:acyltransferase family protein [Candidatus Saccharimonadales bacterium]
MSLKTERKKVLHRVSWVDICRGIAIILVLYGHIFTNDNQRYLIYAFHMPLFFFISGLVFRPIDTKPIKSVFTKYFKQLLIPYYLFALLTYAFALISGTAGHGLGDVAYQLYGIVYGNGNNGMLGYNVVLWFLPCLFITKFSFALITRYAIQTKTILLSLLGTATLGSLVAYFLPWLKLPLGFETALTALSFFGVGYITMKHKKEIDVFIKQKMLLTITTTLFTALVATINYRLSGSQIDLRINHLGNVVLFYLGAFGGIVTWMAVSRMIARNAFLEYIGRHSLIIFAWHNVLFTDLKNVINLILDHGTINTLRYLMPTFYVGIATSIILFMRMIIIRLKGSAIFRFYPSINAN